MQKLQKWAEKLPKLADIYTSIQALCAVILLIMSSFKIDVNYAAIILLIMNFCNAGAFYCTYVSPPNRRQKPESYDYWLELAPRIDFFTASFSGYATFDYADRMINHEIAYRIIIVSVIICAVIQVVLYEYDGFGWDLVEKNYDLAKKIIEVRRLGYVTTLIGVMLWYINVTSFNLTFKGILTTLVVCGFIIVLSNIDNKPIRH